MPAFSHIRRLTIRDSTVNVVYGNQTNQTCLGHSPTRSAALSLSLDKLTLPRLTHTFTGRRDILDQMARCFDKSNASLFIQKQRIFVLHGLGGGGKTQLMLKFVDECGHQFSDIYFVDSSTLATIQSALEDIARKASVGDTAEIALRWLAGERKEWLLLFDNVDDRDVNLAQFFPNCKHGNIIVTTRNNECCQLATDSHCPVSTMSPEDAIELLLKRSMVEHSDDNRRLCAHIADELGYLALAISQAGAYIAKFSCLKDYLQIYREDRAETLLRHSIHATDDYQWTVYTTWETSLKKMTPIAAMFLQVCSFMHCDSIPRRLFKETSMAENAAESFPIATDFLQNFASSGGQWSNTRFNDLIDNLTACSLISINTAGDAYSIHPLVHAWARYRATERERSESCACAIQLLALAITNNYSADSFAFRRTLLPHVDQLRSEIRESHLLVIFPSLYTEAGRWKEAEELQQLAVETLESELAGDHPSVLHAMLNLGVTYSEQGRWDEGMDLMEHVLEVRRNVVGSNDDGIILDVMQNLGHTYSLQSHFPKAAEIRENAMAASRRLLGDEHPYTLTVMSELAWTYARQQRHQEAEALLTGVKEAMTRRFSEEHPITLETMASLAGTYILQHRWKEAESLFVKVLEARMEALGSAHPDTLHIMTNLAIVYDFKGLWKVSEALLVHVLAARRQLLGDDHPNTLTAKANLTWSYIEQGRWKEAEAQQLTVVEKAREVFGNEHHEHSWYRSNLGWIFSHSGDWEKAEKLHLAELEVTRRLFGEDQDVTLRHMRFLGWCYSQQGRLEDAEVYQTSAMKHGTRRKGESNTDTLTVMSHLANTYSRQGRLREAEQLESRVLDTRRRILGDDHPHTLISISALSEYRRCQIQEVHGPVI